MRNDLISIIVPVFNCALYIKDCIKAIKNQTIKNFECFLIDDGSTDNGSKIIHQLIENDKRFIYKYKQNGGASSARNLGLNLCKGSYITFVDADDIISPFYLEYLYNYINKSSADISLCDAREINKKDRMMLNFKKCFPSAFMRDETLNTYDILKKMPRGKNYRYFVVWGKLFKKEILENVRFIEGKIHEDDYFCNEIYAKDISIRIVPYELYFYLLENNNSVSHKEKNSFKWDSYDAMFARYKIIKEFHFDYAKEFLFILSDKLIAISVGHKNNPALIKKIFKLMIALPFNKKGIKYKLSLIKSFIVKKQV